MINKLKATNTYKHLINLTNTNEFLGADEALKIAMLLNELNKIEEYEALAEEELVEALKRIIDDTTYNYIRFDYKNRYHEFFIGTMDEAIEYAIELTQQYLYDDTDEGYYQAEAYVKRNGVCYSVFTSSPHYSFYLTFEEYGLHDLICFV